MHINALHTLISILGKVEVMTAKAPAEAKKISLEEVKRLAKESGEELTAEQLDGISGGWGNNKLCPDGQHNYVSQGLQPCGSQVKELWVCTKCGDGYYGM